VKGVANGEKGDSGDEEVDDEEDDVVNASNLFDCCLPSLPLLKGLSLKKSIGSWLGISV
jgi:hypothetical protein